MKGAMPTCCAEASLYASSVHYRAPGGRGFSGERGALLPQAPNTGGGPQGVDWCDLKHSACMIGCFFKGIYWRIIFRGNVGALPIACEVACDAARTVCKIKKL